MPSISVSNAYLFSRREAGLFIEIYFPKRVLYQDAIIRALQDGVYEEKVKNYMKENAAELLIELAEYPYVLNPYAYKRKPIHPDSITKEEAEKRIEMYKNPFFGWSSYNVEGAFLKRRRKTLEDELTQVVRIIFLFESKHMRSAKEKECAHILRSIASWLLINYYHRMAELPWSNIERDRFISEHTPLSEMELAYIKNHYANVAIETVKWFDDCALFGFGFLVRRFWRRVVEVGYREDEIWVTSLFNLGINMVRPGI